MGIYVGNKRYAPYIGDKRRRYMGSSKKQYIQDGMIAWYDGEWNEDIGVHNSSATKWVNLADKGNDITGIDNTFTWGDDYLLPPLALNVGNIPSYKPLTIECVFQDTSSGAYIPLGLSVYWIGIRANNTVNFSSGGYYVTLASRNAKSSISGIMTDANTARNPLAIYLNGVSSMVSSGGMTFTFVQNKFNATHSFNYGTGTFKFYCIRLYNKQLSEAEVLNNWQIDKQRFGL